MNIYFVFTISLLVIAIIITMIIFVFAPRNQEHFNTDHHHMTDTERELSKLSHIVPTFLRAFKCRVPKKCRSKPDLDKFHYFPKDWCVASSCFLGLLTNINKDAFLSPGIDYHSNYWGVAFNFGKNVMKALNAVPIPPAPNMDTVIIIGEFPQVMFFNVSFYDLDGQQVTTYVEDIAFKPSDQNPFITGNFKSDPKSHYCLIVTRHYDNSPEVAELKKISPNVYARSSIDNKGGLFVTDDGVCAGSIAIRYYGAYDNLFGDAMVPDIFYANTTKKRVYLTNSIALKHFKVEKMILEMLLGKTGQITLPPGLVLTEENCGQLLPKGPFSAKGNVLCYPENCDQAPYFRISLTDGGAAWPNPSAAYMATCLVKQPGKSAVFFGKKPLAPNTVDEIHCFDADMRYWSISFCEYSKLVNVLQGAGVREFPDICINGDIIFIMVLSTEMVRNRYESGGVLYLRWPKHQDALQSFYRHTLTNPSFTYSINAAKKVCKDAFHGLDSCCCMDPQHYGDDRYRKCCQEDVCHCEYGKGSCPSCPAKEQGFICPTWVDDPLQTTVCNCNIVGPQQIMQQYYPRITFIPNTMLKFPGKIIEHVASLYTKPLCGSQFQSPWQV